MTDCTLNQTGYKSEHTDYLITNPVYYADNILRCVGWLRWNNSESDTALTKEELIEIINAGGRIVTLIEKFDEKGQKDHRFTGDQSPSVRCVLGKDYVKVVDDNEAQDNLGKLDRIARWLDEKSPQ